MFNPTSTPGPSFTLFDDTFDAVFGQGSPLRRRGRQRLRSNRLGRHCGGKVELAFNVDTPFNGSEWADICAQTTAETGQRTYFQGIKPMLEEGNMTVYETIYGLGNTLGAASPQPSATTRTPVLAPRCSGRPRRRLRRIRKLPGTIYNGNTYSGYSGEDWGPGSNCLSFLEGRRRQRSRQPTDPIRSPLNPNATKIDSVSDEGPKDGDLSQQADDKAAIQEAHDNCLLAGVVPVGLYGQGYGGGISSPTMDLVQCPNGIVSTQTRNCPGNTLATPTLAARLTSSHRNRYQPDALLSKPWFGIRQQLAEIYMSVLDPYAKMNNDPSSTPGLPGHSAQVARTRRHRCGRRRPPRRGQRHPRHH